MDLGLKDKVVLITGGSSGIGLAAAKVCLSSAQFSRCLAPPGPRKPYRDMTPQIVLQRGGSVALVARKQQLLDGERARTSNSLPRQPFLVTLQLPSSLPFSPPS